MLVMHFALVTEQTTAVGEALNFGAAGLGTMERTNVFVVVFAEIG